MYDNHRVARELEVRYDRYTIYSNRWNPERFDATKRKINAQFMRAASAHIQEIYICHKFGPIEFKGSCVELENPLGKWSCPLSVIYLNTADVGRSKEGNAEGMYSIVSVNTRNAH